ncbi:MAG: porin [Pseudomonadota bacterium]
MTKKLLLSSTALVGAFALATPALADIEVTLSGQVEFGASVGDEETVDDAERGYTFFMDSETKIEAEGAAENGINYSAKVELETDADAGGSEAFNADETRLAFWGGFGRVELGREDGAADNMFVGGEDFQAGTGGIDGDSANLALPGVTDSGDAAKVTYFTPRVSGFQLGASYTVDTGDAEGDNDDADDIEDHVELGANFTTSAGGADITLTAVASIGDGEDAVGDDLEDYGIGGGVEFGGLGIGAGYIIKEDLAEGDAFTVGATYGFGPANVSAGYSYDDPDGGDEVGVFSLAADYGLFPGVTVKGDIAFNDEDSDADGDSTTAGVVTIQVDY